MSTPTHVSDGVCPLHLRHSVPSQPVHLCRHISIVSNCPGYTFGYTLAGHHRDRGPLSNISSIPHHLTVMYWLHTYRSITGTPVRTTPKTPYRTCLICT